MRILKTISIAVFLALCSAGAHADDCPGDDTVTFNFDEVEMAFAILANHAGLTPAIDPSIAFQKTHRV